MRSSFRCGFFAAVAALILFLSIPYSQALAADVSAVRVQGIVHDSEHHPIQNAAITLQSAGGGTSATATSNQDGYFSFTSVPSGTYTVTILSSGFDITQTRINVLAASAPMLHFMLHVGSVQQSVHVHARAQVVNPDAVTPTTNIGRDDIARTPGADRTDSVAMITSYVPGAYLVHDMLHIRGGHQISWQLDGIEIPNTNVGSNLGPQIDPKDIRTLEVQRGSESADLTSKTYGAFDIVPRTGFDRDNLAEITTSFGSFDQTNDQINFGSHTEKFAYYASLNGNRTNYGLQPPTPQAVHDAANGVGGFASLLYNATPKDQLRSVVQLRKDYFQIPYDPVPASVENQIYNSSGLRDGQKETDGLATFTWAHTLNASTLLRFSPFYHYNSANYQPGVHDLPIAATSNHASNYAGVQASLGTEIHRNTIQAGVYAFGQHDHVLLGAAFNNGSFTDFQIQNSTLGALTEEYLSDSFKASNWLTMIAGLRSSQFTASLTEMETEPRVGLALHLPKIDWVFRAFYGRYYQAPPQVTAAGPLLNYANSANTAFSALHGERDEERQFGVQIPLRGWLLDADTFQNRAKNYLDHSNVGESNLFFPVTIDGALIQAWELTLRSPRRWRYGQAHLAYSNQVAKQRGPITGGLICAPAGSPQCSVPFVYTPLDHDQRNTLNTGFDATLPRGIFSSLSMAYGSGFFNGTPNAEYPGAYLPSDTSVNLSLGKTFRDKTTVSVTATNLADHRVLVDNSLTFGGFHYNDPREIFGEVRFRFHYGRLFAERNN